MSLSVKQVLGANGLVKVYSRQQLSMCNRSQMLKYLSFRFSEGECSRINWKETPSKALRKSVLEDYDSLPITVKRN